MSHRSTTTARRFVLAVNFLSVFFLMCNSVFAQDKTGSGDKIKELKEKRLVLLLKIHKVTDQAWQAGAGKITFAQVQQASADLIAARLDLAEKKEDRVRICEDHVKIAEALEKRVVDRFNLGDPAGPTGLDVDRAQVYVLETRIALEKAKAAASIGQGQKRPTEPDVAGDLLKAQVASARRVYELTIKAYKERVVQNHDLESLCLWSMRWLDAERGLSKKPADRIAAAEAHLERMKTVEAMAIDLAKIEPAAGRHAAAAEFYRVQAQIWLSQAKDK